MRKRRVEATCQGAESRDAGSSGLMEAAFPARIDELVAPGKKDIHGHYGDYCYVGFRHSFCHGWASGPTAWLSQHLLGVQPLEPGFKKVRIAPQLGRLQWAEGTYPTPHGPINVRHERRRDGTIISNIKAPPGVKVVQSGNHRFESR